MNKNILRTLMLGLSITSTALALEPKGMFDAACPIAASDQFQLSSRRAGLTQNEQFHINNAVPSSALTGQDNQNNNFQLEGQRIAILRDGVLEVKQGRLNAHFVKVADNVERFNLDASRIAILRKGVLEVKDGVLNAPFVRVAD